MGARTPESEFRRTHKRIEPRFLRSDVELRECPVETSMGVLGKKWTILIIRDIGTYRRERFHQLLKSLACIAPKVLATRLKELEAEGFLERRVERSRPPKVVRWTLTEKGMDATRVGMMVAAFGAKWHPDRIFLDDRPRSVRELYAEEGIDLLKRGL